MDKVNDYNVSIRVQEATRFFATTVTIPLSGLPQTDGMAGKEQALALLANKIKEFGKESP